MDDASNSNLNSSHKARGEGEDVLTRALREEEMEQLKAEQLYETARALRNEKILKTRHGKVIENLFECSTFDIPPIWIAVREFQNWHNVLKVHKFKDPPYGMMMKHILSKSLQLRFIEDIKAPSPIKHDICINDVIVLDFQDVIARHGGRCAVELKFDQESMPWTDIKYILQDLGHYFQRALVIPPQSALSHKICRDIMVDYQQRFVDTQDHIGSADLLFQLKRRGILIPDAVMNNVALSVAENSNGSFDGSHGLSESVGRSIGSDGAHWDLFERHPVAWLLNHYYFMMYLGYTRDGALSFAANYHRHQMEDEVDPHTVARNIYDLMQSKGSLGLSLQYFIGSYRRKYGEFPRGGAHFKCTLSDYIKDSGVFLAYYPQEVSALRMFQNRVWFFFPFPFIPIVFFLLLESAFLFFRSAHVAKARN